MGQQTRSCEIFNKLQNFEELTEGIVQLKEMNWSIFLETLLLPRLTSRFSYGGHLRDKLG